MKRIKMKMIAIALIVAIAVATPVVTPFSGNMAVAEAATVKISKTKVSLMVAETVTLKITGTKSKVAWKSSNNKIASVTAKGVVTAESVGTAKITATVNKKAYTCSVTVNPGENPYHVNSKQVEVQMGGLGFVVPKAYDISGGEESDGVYKATLTIPGSMSSLTVVFTQTGEAAYSYEDVANSLEGKTQETLQADYDSAYGAGKTEVSDFSTFPYESQNGTTSFAYSYMLTSATASARTISYNLSIDGYLIEVISVDAEGYDIYIDAEYAIDSLRYLPEY